MFPEHLTSFTFYQKKRDILIYKAEDDSHSYILKCIISEDETIKQAFYDEYEALHQIFHPSIPVYYGFCENFRLPDREKTCLALCMEYCEGIPLSGAAGALSLPALLSVVHQTGTLLSFLLAHGVLYTDLHPDNLLIRKEERSLTKDGNQLSLTLLDYTYCYYFLNNPAPAYPLRFSYDLSPDLKGQQLLIQELTFLLHALLDIRDTSLKNAFSGSSPQGSPFLGKKREDAAEASLPFSVCALLETGAHPAENLSLTDFLHMLEKCL